MNTTVILSSISPAYNAKNVPISTSIVLFFKESMKTDSLNENTIFLSKGSHRVPLDFKYERHLRKLTIDPLVPLDGDTIYGLTVLSKEEGPVTSLGAGSDREYNVYFTTEAVSEPVEPPKEPDEEEPGNSPEEPEEPPIEEETPPEVPVPTPEPEEPFIGNLALVDSYPKADSLVKDLKEIVLLFNTKVKVESLSENIFLQEKALSPLLRKLSEQTRVGFQIDATGGETVVLNLSSDLAAGKEYELILNKDISAESDVSLTLGFDQSLVFRTQWELFFTTVESVKLVLGAFKEAYTDNELAEMIYQQSLGTYQVMSMKPDFDSVLWTGTYPYAASQYVLYRTAYQAMLGQIIESSSGMKQSISLADLSVSDSSSVSSDIVDLISLFQEEMDKWWKMLNGVEEIEEIDGIYMPRLNKNTSTAVRGGNESPYPNFLTRASFNDLGG